MKFHLQAFKNRKLQFLVFVNNNNNNNNNNDNDNNNNNNNNNLAVFQCSPV